MIKTRFNILAINAFGAGWATAFFGFVQHDYGFKRALPCLVVALMSAAICIMEWSYLMKITWRLDE